MSLTDIGESSVEGVPVTIDEQLPRPPKHQGRLTLRERYANLRGYLRPIIRAARPSRPRSIGLFAGSLEYGSLKWWAVLFVTVVVQAPAGDRRNWDAIRSWAASLPEAFWVRAEDRVRSPKS